MIRRVVQWGTGLVGSAAATKVLEHPELELVGCYAHGADKAGRDVGAIIGVGDTGVIATGDVEQIIASRPDCVLYMPLAWNVDHMVCLLEAGINIVSTANFITGRSYGAADEKRLRDAAERGGVTLYGTGINPGQLNIIGLALTAGCRRVDRITMREAVDATHYASPGTWESLGFGGPPDAPGLAERVKERSLVFYDTVDMVAKGLALPIDDIAFHAEFSTATKDLDIKWMDFPQGSVCALRMTYSGMVAGREVIALQLAWRIGDAMTPDWMPEGYVIEIEGQPNARAVFHYEDDPSSGGYTTAMNAVYSVEAVCRARPGILTATDLPLIAGRYSAEARGEALDLHPHQRDHR